MKKPVIIIIGIVLLVIISGVIWLSKTNPTMPETPVVKEDKTTDNGKDYLNIGFDLIGKESIGVIYLGTLAAVVLKELGEAGEKSEALVAGADGLEHQSWRYKTKGIELDMIRKETIQSVSFIHIESPCKYRTARNIGIGSTRKEVIKAYQNEIDTSQFEEGKTINNTESLIAGTVYGGVMFGLKGNRVIQINMGAAAE